MINGEKNAVINSVIKITDENFSEKHHSKISIQFPTKILPLNQKIPKEVK